MQTQFTAEQLQNPDIREIDQILRACVHCGFCTATCPTYVEDGDERDSPRGRIYLIKDMFERGGPADEETATHVDRCLTCLSCMTTCPSGVDYMHLVDHARVHIEETRTRPLPERLLRRMLASVLPRPALFRLALIGATLARPFAALAPGRLAGLIRMAPRQLPAPSTVDRPQVFPAEGPRRMRVALMTGCAQQVLDPRINEATIRLLTRHGCEVVVARGAGCCGALTQHMGLEEAAKASARANVAAWMAERRGAGLDAVVINASGCGTTVKDYGHLLAGEADAAVIAGLARDVTEVVAELGITPPDTPSGLKVAYHAACSLQHGQRVRDVPKTLLRSVGFTIAEIPEAHLCCGSAGTYNLLQPDMAARLQARKVSNIRSTGADLVAAGNIGCLVQIGQGLEKGGAVLPVVHTVELLDWATGGPRPPALQ
ncbi:MAG: glycolate oxidase subunit GlcF [Ferrovibrionaceae bacterium]